MRNITLTLVAVLVLGCAGIAAAATEVKMTGDARVHANWWSQRNYTGWTSSTAAGTGTYDPFTIYERFRLRTDFIANENLKFRLGIRANNTAWGSRGYGVDNYGNGSNTTASFVDVYQAFLQFKWPGSDVQFSIGLQDTDLPISSGSFFNSNPVLGGTRMASAIVTVPFNEMFKLTAGFTRLVDANPGNDVTTTQVADEFDGYFMALPITLDGFTATPWGLLAVAGNSAGYGTIKVGTAGTATLASNLLAPGDTTGARLRNTQNVYWWLGSAFSVTAVDSFKFYADVMYGQGNAADRARDFRGGLFFDVGVEYTGLDMLTPQLTFWYSTGEDNSLGNGSERMPTVVGMWGSSNSFLLDSSQAFGTGGYCMALNPIGSWGFVAALDKISFVQDLTHRIAFTYAHGTNASGAIRRSAGITAAGFYNSTAPYVQMGRDLTVSEYVMGINFDHKYNIYENLAAIIETGWAHGSFERSVWGRRLVNQANNGDAWKVAFGLQYKF